MSSPAAADGEPKLPQAIVDEILKRLPARSLLRFRCVSRSWRSAIDDPGFVALHLSHSAVDASNWYLVSLNWGDPVQRLCALFRNECLSLSSQSRIELPYVAPSKRYGIVGSCNGLICVAEKSIYGYGQPMCLCNSSTGKHKAVRLSGLEHHLSFSMETVGIVQGFGFDARSNDYKIVRILYFSDVSRRYFGGTKSRVEIYSLAADSWKSLERECPAFLTHVHPPVFFNGNLHWHVLKGDDLRKGDGGESIVSFNVAGEVFDVMALPKEMFHLDSVSVGLVVSVAVLNDLLAVFISRDRDRDEPVGHPELHSICSVWVMTDYGVRESWTRLYTFEYSGLVARFEDFTWNGELLMDIDGGERVSWNPITGKFTNLPLSSTHDLVTVVESLVSL